MRRQYFVATKRRLFTNRGHGFCIRPYWPRHPVTKCYQRRYVCKRFFIDINPASIIELKGCLRIKVLVRLWWRANVQHIKLGFDELLAGRFHLLREKARLFGAVYFNEVVVEIVVI